MAHKKLFEFTVTKEEVVDIPVESTNETGDKVVTHKKETKKVPYKFFLRKPSRSLLDDANLYYGVKLSEGIRAGLITIPLLEKRNIKDGGIFTDEEKTKMKDLYSTFFAKTEELQKIGAIKENERTKEQTERREELIKELTEIQKKVQEYDDYKSSIYEHTAEMRARNLTIVWWMMFLSYQLDGDKEIPYFGDGVLNDRIGKYDDLLENDDAFIQEVIKRFLYAVSFWVINQANDSDDFKALEKLLDSDAQPQE